MSDVDRVFTECTAAPADDAPRLVWADLAGGERGELVVLQCDLARGGLTPTQVASRRRRERELLDRHAVEWAGELATIAKRWSFRRGFIEAAVIELSMLDLAVLERWPLVRSVTFQHSSRGFAPVEEVKAYFQKLRAFGVGGLSQQRTAWLDEVARIRFDGLRALAFDQLEGTAYPAALELIRAHPIEQLRIREHWVEDVQIGALIAAAPALQTVEIGRAAPLELVAGRSLRALHVGGVAEDERAALEACGATLEQLHVTTRLPEWAYDVIGRMPRLRVLEIAIDPPMIGRAIEAGARLERLELVIIGGAHAVRGEIERRAEAFAGELCVGAVREAREAFGAVLHEAPEALLTLGRPCCGTFAPATFARLDVEDIHEVPELPLDTWVHLGRGSDVIVQVDAPSVARHHARVTWEADHHEIEDTGSTNGTIVNHELVNKTTLRDGDQLQLGEVVLRYFVGDGARERADNAQITRRRAAAFERVIDMIDDERCSELATRVSLDPAEMPAVAHAVLDCLIRHVLTRPGRYGSFHERPALRALAPICDAASRDAARAALAHEEVGKAGGSASLALEMLDELERTDERDPLWQEMCLGPMFMAVTRAQAAGIVEMPAMMAAMLASLTRDR